MLYRFADAVLDSDIALPELPPAPAGPSECRIRAGAPAISAPSVRWHHRWTAADGSVALESRREHDRYWLGMPGLAIFLIEDGGGMITCRPNDGVSSRTVEHLLIDQVLPRVLAHRGRLVLHAGCVAAAGGAVGFLGGSGTGKSTLCAGFARAAHPVLGDDGVVVRHDGDGFAVVATYPGLRLLPPSLRLFGSEAAEPVADYTAKRRLRPRASGFTDPGRALPLTALYLLAEGRTIAVEALEEREAFMTLVRSCFQLHLDDRARSAHLFGQIGALAGGVPVRRLAYPRDLGRLDAVREVVLADVADRAMAGFASA